MDKEQVYIQRIKDLQEEVEQKNQIIRDLIEENKTLRDLKDPEIHKAEFLAATEEAREILKQLKQEKHEIEKLKAEMGERIQDLLYK